MPENLQPAINYHEHFVEWNASVIGDSMHVELDEFLLSTESDEVRDGLVRLIDVVSGALARAYYHEPEYALSMVRQVVEHVGTGEFNGQTGIGVVHFPSDDGIKEGQLARNEDTHRFLKHLYSALGEGDINADLLNSDGQIELGETAIIFELIGNHSVVAKIHPTTSDLDLLVVQNDSFEPANATVA